MRAALLVIAGLALIGYVAVAWVLPAMAGSEVKAAAQALVAGAEPAKQQVSDAAEKEGNLNGAGNGIKVVDYNRDSALLASLVARSKFADNERFGKAEKSGILLQDHNDAVKFRSIKIRTLSE